MASSRKAKSLTAIIEALPIDLRDRVVERAAIIAESGTDWEEADRLAYEMETGRSSPGLARASERPAAPPSEQEAKSGTTKGR